MAEIWFYHLERSALSEVLPPLLEKGLERGWRAMVKTTLPERLAELDDLLWTYREDSFLAHGRSDHADPELQPVLLGLSEERMNGAELLILIDRARAYSYEAFQRSIILFDGRDEAALSETRTEWQALKAAGHALAYWQQGEKGWVKRA